MNVDSRPRSGLARRADRSIVTLVGPVVELALDENSSLILAASALAFDPAFGSIINDALVEGCAIVGPARTARVSVAWNICLDAGIGVGPLVYSAIVGHVEVAASFVYVSPLTSMALIVLDRRWPR